MVIQLHRADGPRQLADEFASLLAGSPADVFTPEVVVVPARGVERWLAQRLSHSLGAEHADDGVAAGLKILTPGSLISMLLGRDRDDPWQPDRLVWPTLAAIDELCGSPGFEAITHHLGAGPPITGDANAEWRRKARQSRRYAVARRLAALFASYARDRPQILDDWEAGRSTDGCGGALPTDLAWQPPLWRRVVELTRARYDVDESVTQRQRRVVQQVESGELKLDLSGRLSFFGYTRLAASELALIRALGQRRTVHIWLPHPSPALWSALASSPSPAHDRADDDSAAVAHHPLLATLGRDGRELQASLAVLDATDASTSSETGSATTRLALLQHDIRHNLPPDQSRVIAADDRSIQVHACYGRARQVEVLREVLTGLLADHKGALQPRDILVMCPDIESFAPLLRATFGLGDTGDDAPVHPGQTLRVQLADRALAATNPLVDLAHRLVQTVAGRMTATELLDLAGHESVRRRFGFDEDALARISRWVADAGVRWGYDGAHRGEYGLGGLDANTWAAGLDRVALGVAVADDSEGFAGALVPIDDIGSRDIELVGRVLEFMDAIKAAADGVRAGTPRGALPAPEWMAWLSDAIDALAAVKTDEQWQVGQLHRELNAIADTAGDSVTLRLSDIRALLEQRWAARPGRANFRTGGITICSMVPMRSVPHQAIVVLGLDDGVYPRSLITDGDDALARRPQIGERDVRSEDRQLLLDAVMAAGQHFVAIYSGADERNGSVRPPAVPLQELIAVAARTATTDGTTEGEAHDDRSFVRRHPLQAFDERNFRADSPLPGGSFDRSSLEGATALRRMRETAKAPRQVVGEPLTEAPNEPVTVEQIVMFLQNPAREFLRNRLDVMLPREDDEADDGVPISLDGLKQWAVGDRVLTHALRGQPIEQLLDREEVRGSLPPGALANDLRADLTREISAIADSSATIDKLHRSVDVHLDLPTEKEGGTTRFTGVVSGIIGDDLWMRTYSRIGPKQIVAAWVRLLALTLTEPGSPHVAQLRGRRTSFRLRSPEPQLAEQILADLVRTRRSGLRFPMGVPPKTTSLFVEKLRQAAFPETAVHSAFALSRTEWEGDRFDGENADPAWTFVLGRKSAIEELNRNNGLSYFGPRIWNPIHQHLDES
ncbi:exodeoxyribonuclease V subunit gamma [Yimella sp. cx-573]|nr:exodeoxyribonuclease V subunit gamma [Yimella sp. cx-573]